MSSFVTLDAANEAAGAIVFWSLGGDADLARMRLSLELEEVPEKFWPEGPTYSEALLRGARAQANQRQLVRPLGKRGAWALVQEHVSGDVITHTQVLVGHAEPSADVGGLGAFRVQLSPGVERTEATDALIENILAEGLRQVGLVPPVDMSGWLVRVATQLHAVPLRDRGGVYFVPRDVLETWRRISAVVASESQGRTFEIPALKTDEAVDAILTSVRAQVAKQFAALEDYLLETPSNKGLNSWERQLDEMRSYVRHYVELLGVALPELESRLVSLSGALVATRMSLREKAK